MEDFRKKGIALFSGIRCKGPVQEFRKLFPNTSPIFCRWYLNLDLLNLLLA